jgi:translation initiation factor IF-1
MGENDRERLEMTGRVIEANRGQFRVETEGGMIVLCTLGGRVRQNSVKILLGDICTIEVSPYDVTRGRITFRHKS